MRAAAASVSSNTALRARGALLLLLLLAAVARTASAATWAACCTNRAREACTMVTPLPLLRGGLDVLWSLHELEDCCAALARAVFCLCDVGVVIGESRMYGCWRWEMMGRAGACAVFCLARRVLRRNLETARASPPPPPVTPSPGCCAAPESNLAVKRACRPIQRRVEEQSGEKGRQARGLQSGPHFRRALATLRAPRAAGAAAPRASIDDSACVFNTLSPSPLRSHMIHHSPY